MSGRNPFTDSDDDHLVLYIAKYNPQGAGRQGNNLYKTLEENANNQWSWSKRHTWQSWRERYKKNQDYFDRRIKRELKKQHPAAAVLKPVAGPSKPVKMSTTEQVHKAANGKTGTSNAAKDAASRAANQARTTTQPKKTVTSKPAEDEVKTVREEKRPVEKNKSEEAPKTTNGKGGMASNSTSIVKDALSRAANTEPTSGQPKKTVTAKPVAGPSKPVQQENQPTENKRKEQAPKAVNEKSATASNTAKAALARTEPVVKPKPAPTKKTVAAEPAGEGAEDEVSDSQGEDEEAPAPPVGGDDCDYELFGTFVEDDEEDEQDPEQRSPSRGSSPDYNNIYPDLASAPEPALAEKEPYIPGAFESQRPLTPSQEPTPPKSDAPVQSPPQPRKLKRKVVRDEDDPFATPSPSSPPAKHPIVTISGGQPPVLVEGPFRNSLKRVRPVADDAGGESWPPKRRKKAAQDVEMADAKPLVGGGRTDFAKRPKKPVAAAPPPPTPLAPRRIQQQVNAVPSSSKVKLPEAPAVRPTLPTFDQRNVPAVLKESLAKNAPLAVKSEETAHQEAVRPASMHPVSENDIFTSHKRDSSKGKAREEPQVAPRRIDLHRESLQKRLNQSTSRRSSVVSSGAAAISDSNNVRHRRRRESRLSVLSSNEVTLLSLLKRNFANLGREYGFSVETVEKTFANTGDLEKTRIVLEHLCATMRAAEHALYIGMPHLFLDAGEQDGDGDGAGEEEEEEIPEGVVPYKRPAEKEEERTLTSPRRQGPGGRNSGSSRRSARPSLNFKPLPPDQPDILSDYSPPNASRAGQYARLVRQGRKAEALEREKRRASGLFVPYTQERERGQAQRGSSPMSNPSPTPRARDVPMQVDGDFQQEEEQEEQEEDDDMYVDGDEQHEADDEYENSQASQAPVQLQEHLEDNFDANADANADALPARPSHQQEHQYQQQLLQPKQRNSEGQTTLNDATDEEQLLQLNSPALRALAAEHRRLTFEVTAENADAKGGLREFEEKGDKDLMRRWSMQWIEERVAMNARARQEEQERAREEAAAKAADEQLAFERTMDE